MHLEPSQSSKMELCAKIVNDFQLLNIFAKKLDLRYFSGFWISLYFIQYTRDDKKNLNVLFKMIFWNLSLWLLEDLYWIYALCIIYALYIYSESTYPHMLVSMVKPQMKFQIICIHYSLFMEMLPWLPITGLCIIDIVKINLKNKHIFS